MWDRALDSVELLGLCYCSACLPTGCPRDNSHCSSAGRDAAVLFQVVVSLIAFISFTLL